jgi:hypothetical protein
MNGSNRCKALAVGLTLVLALGGADTARAQATEPAPKTESLGPLQLAPPRPDAPVTAPSGIEAAPLPGGEPAPAASAASGIQTETLGSISPDSVGILDPTTGGLPATAWAGMTRTEIYAAIRDLPAGLRSPAERALLRRLLLSTATVPEATAEDASVPSLLATRISKLMALGEIESAADLAEGARSSGRDLALARARIEALFTAGRIEPACAVQPVPTLQGYNVRVTAVCSLAGGDKAKGKAALQAARQAGADAAFLALGDSILGTGKGPAAAFTPNAFHIALYRLTAATPPADLLKLTDETWVAALPRLKGLSAPARANAAHAAAVRSLITPAALGEIYAAVKLKPEEANAALAASGPADARAIVAARAAMAATTDGSKIGDILDKLWPRLGDLAGPEAALIAQDLRLLSPESLPGGLRAKGALLFFAQNDAVEARRWTTAAESAGETAAATAQWPLAVMAGTRPASFGELTSWIDSAAAKPAAAERTLAALDALGEPVPSDVWRRLLASAPPPAPAASAAILRALEAAAGSGRSGEVASLSLQALSGAGPADSHPMALAAALRSLKAAGLEREARALALEAAAAGAR